VFPFESLHEISCTTLIKESWEIGHLFRTGTQSTPKVAIAVAFASTILCLSCHQVSGLRFNQDGVQHSCILDVTNAMAYQGQLRRLDITTTLPKSLVE